MQNICRSSYSLTWIIPIPVLALGLSPDVAGATFMAAGSSAPELATSVIGAFVAKDDIGVGSVVGSAVFNITLVVAVCSLSATHAIQLSWYSVCR